MNHLIRLSLRYRGLVVLLALVAMVTGSYLATTMPIDVFPDLDRPRVVLLTECFGLSPEEVETLVTQPIETAILGAPGVQAVRGQSSQGLAVTYIEFDWNMPIREARQIVQERLTSVASTLPSGIRPTMTPPTSIMGQIMIVGMYHRKGPMGGDLEPLGRTGLIAERTVQGNQTALILWKPIDRNRTESWVREPISDVSWDDEKTPRTVTFTVRSRVESLRFRTAAERRMGLRTTADWVIRPRLLKEQGIAEVLIVGGDRKQVQVLVDSQKLLEFGVTLGEVEKAIRENNDNASGGFTEEGLIERPVRVMGRLGPLPEKVLSDLRQIPVKMTSQRSILLSQVAQIVEGPTPKRGDGGIDGFPAVVITLVKQPHADTRSLTDRIAVALEEAEKALPADIVINSDLFRLKGFIDRGVYGVGEALVIGGVLVVIILFLFLLNVRTTLITLTAIPLSLVITVLTFRLIGAITGQALSINVMTLGGIAVAMGELVDDAIVDVENIYRRLRENRAAVNPKPALRVVYEASREVRSAVVFGTAVVILAFLPLFALSGVEGRLFVPLGMAYIISILGSLLVSLTVTPVLSYFLLAHSKSTEHTGDGILVRVLKWAASLLIRLSMRRAGILLVLTWMLVAVSMWQLSRLGADFLPKFDEGSIQINVGVPVGSSLRASNEAAAVVDATLRKMQQTPENPDGAIRHFVRRTGRAELDEHAEPVSRSEYILNMNPNAGTSREVMLRTLLAELRDGLPGIDIEAEQPLSHLISHMISGVNAQIAIKVYGDDLNQLQRTAEQIKSTIASIPGVTPPVIDPQETVDELHIVLRPADLAYFGISRAYVSEFIQTAMKGEAVSQVVEGIRRFDLVVKLQESERTDYGRLKELRLDLPDGRGQIRLGEVADFPAGAGGPNAVQHDNIRRRAVIRCNVSGRDLSSVVVDIERRVTAEVAMPEGYFVEYGGQFEAQRSATRLIGVLAGVSILGIFVTLYLLVPSIRIALQILNAIPTAFIGGVAALVLTQQTLTVASLVGFVSLGGIAVRNGILLVTHYLHLMKEEGETLTSAMILRGSLERLSPVLMTALTAGIGLVPLVVSGQRPGLEILYPVATVILGGLVTSTFCEFLIHPGLFWKFSGQDAEQIARSTDVDGDPLSA